MTENRKHFDRDLQPIATACKISISFHFCQPLQDIENTRLKGATNAYLSVKPVAPLNDNRTLIHGWEKLYQRSGRLAHCVPSYDPRFTGPDSILLQLYNAELPAWQ
jgi:hypothetical protein